MANPKIIVVGGGLAGLSASIKIAEAGGNVDLFSVVPVKRSHSVCAQGGINAAKNLKGEGDTTWQHFDDTGTRVDGRNWYCHVFGTGLCNVWCELRFPGANGADAGPFLPLPSSRSRSEGCIIHTKR